MSKISNIKIDQNTYDIRATAIPYGVVDDTSTSTAYTVTVPGITELTDGVCCLIKNGVVTSAAGFTINVNNLGAKPSYSNMAAATADTTLFNINYTMLFIYDSTRVSGGCWICYRGYNSDADSLAYRVRHNSSTLPVTAKFYRYRLLFTSADGTHYVPANTSSSTNATASRTVNQTPIDPFGEILYYGSTTAVSAEAAPAAAQLWQQNVCVLGYSFNRTGAALVLQYPKPVYLKCAPQTNGSVIIDSDTPYVQALPSTNDGKIYILLGIAYDETHLALLYDHPVYYHDGTGIRIWTGKTIPSKTSELTNDSGFITSSSLNGYATENYVTTAVSNLVDSAPQTLDTLNELAAALGDDPNFATTVTNALANKADKTDLQITFGKLENGNFYAATYVNGAWLVDNNPVSSPKKDHIYCDVFTRKMYEMGATDWLEISKQVNADWNASSGVAQILNKPNLATVATSGSYNDLTNKPTIPSLADAKPFIIEVTSSGSEDEITYSSQTTPLEIKSAVEAGRNIIVWNSGSYYYLTGYGAGVDYVNAVFSQSTGNGGSMEAIASSIIMESFLDGGVWSVDWYYDEREYIQPDWNVTNDSSAAYIKNKPTIPTVDSSLTGSSQTNPVQGGAIYSALRGKAGTVYYEDVDEMNADTTQNGGTLAFVDDGSGFHIWSASDMWWYKVVTPNDLSSYVPTTRKINNKPLSSDITLTASDVGAISTSHPANAITSAKITEWDGKQDADFVVTATSQYDQNDEFTGYTVNKTYAQIYGAFDDGKRVILVLDGWLIYHLLCADEDTVTFYKVSRGSTTAIEFIYIDNSNGVETAYKELQPLLVSGTNIKTINNQSLLGSGNISIVAPDEVREGKLVNGSWYAWNSISYDTTATTMSQKDAGALFIDLPTKEFYRYTGSAFEKLLTGKAEKAGSENQLFTAQGLYVTSYNDSTTGINIDAAYNSSTQEDTLEIMSNSGSLNYTFNGNSEEIATKSDVLSSLKVGSVAGKLYRNNVGGTGNFSISGNSGCIPNLTAGTFLVAIYAKSATQSYSFRFNFGSSVSYDLSTTNGEINDIRQITIPSSGTFSGSVLTSSGVASGTILYVVMYNYLVPVSTVGVAAVTNRYSDLDGTPTIPAVNNGTLTIQNHGVTVGTFTANQSGNTNTNITTPIVTVSTTGSVTQALDPNKFYDFTGSPTSLTLTLNSGNDLCIYAGKFTAGTGFSNLTFPSTVKVADGAPSVEAGGVYEFSVMNNLLLLAKEGS